MPLTVTPARRLATRACALVAVAAMGLVGPIARAAGADADVHTDLQWTAEAARGHYGEPDRATIVTMPLVVRHRRGAWTAQIEVPWVRIDSTERIVPGIGAVDAVPRQQRTVVSGLGDVWLKLTYEIVSPSTDATGFDLTLKVKTASGDFERGLGSGGTDVALQVEALRRVGLVTLFGHVGHRRTGDVGGLTPYRDPWYGEIGALHHLTPACEWGASYSHRQAIGRLGALGEFTALAACRDGARRVQVYLTRGTQPASPDLAIGVGVRQRF